MEKKVSERALGRKYVGGREIVWKGYKKVVPKWYLSGTEVVPFWPRLTVEVTGMT